MQYHMYKLKEHTSNTLCTQLSVPISKHWEHHVCPSCTLATQTSFISKPCLRIPLRHIVGLFVHQTSSFCLKGKTTYKVCGFLFEGYMRQLTTSNSLTELW